jgi:hypothetical protein
MDGRPRDGRAKEGVDQLARARRVVVALHPQLRERRVDRQLARDARGVRVEDARANAAIGEMVREQVRFGKVRSDKYLLQNFIESAALTPCSLMPERPETL